MAMARICDMCGNLIEEGERRILTFKKIDDSIQEPREAKTVKSLDLHVGCTAKINDFINDQKKAKVEA